MARPALKHFLSWLGLLLITGMLYSQNPVWMYWDPWTCTIPSRYLSDIDIDNDGNKWIGTEPVCGGGICTSGGLAVFDGVNWLVYDSLNSTLNSNYIGSVHVDTEDVVWVGTNHGEISSYDGNSWQSHPFPTKNNVPIFSIDSDLYGYIWAATGGSGLYMYDGMEWQHHHSGNSILSDYLSSVVAAPDNAIWTGGTGSRMFKYTGEWTELQLPSSVYFTSCISINHENNIWVGSDGIFCNYFSGEWTVYDESTTGIPDTAIGYIFDIEFDMSGNTWIGHSKGLIKYNGSEWTSFLPTNSGLLSEHIQCLTADDLGNLWIGTADTGLIAYQEGGVVRTEERRTKNENQIVLDDPYPNPSKSGFNVSMYSPGPEEIEISLLDLNGRLIREITRTWVDEGKHTFTVSEKELKGVFLLRLKTSQSIFTRKVILH